MSYLRLRALPFLVACFSWAALACGQREGSATRLILVADTDISELSAVRFEVTSPGGQTQRAVADVQPGQPGWLVLERTASGEAGPYDVLVQGLVGETEYPCHRVASVSFQAGQTRVVPLHLVAACVDEGPCTRPDQVCSHDGCRARMVRADELSPWTGEPPRLRSGGGDAGVVRSDAASSPSDAGAEAGSGGGGAVPDATAPNDAGRACRAGTSCVGEELALCQDGDVIGSAPCESSRECVAAGCREGQGCVEQPADDGTPCSGGRQCFQGECTHLKGCESPSCMPRCDQAEVECALDCEGASNCAPFCVAGTSCDVLCRDASRCDVVCRGDCAVDCRGSNTCDVECRENGVCDISCPSGGCQQVECLEGKRCLMRCSSPEGCGFAACAGGETACSDTLKACNRPCP